jgi:hydrophobic/amphiphilic exporter-1 (mainly G- bacteria), HAE1 family
MKISTISFFTNYATNNLKDPLARIGGVANAEVMGAMTYSMRIWMNPDRMNALNVTVSDLRNALNEQNILVAAGKLGEGPTLPGQQFEYTIQAQGRLVDPEEFENIVIRSRVDGSFIRLGDVARVELGSESYAIKARLNNDPTAFVVIYQLPGSNAVEIAEDVHAEMERLAEQFPDGLSYEIFYDTTRFITRSIEEVVTTLFTAVGLVILVVFLFLQNWRSTLVPAVAIPVSLIGTFALMLAMGYSINLITLFGLILAIGIVVDDAIVVTENVVRIMTEEGLDARAATVKAMQQVSGPIIATTLVLLAVFVPVSFMPGITGELYTQFSVTISVAVIISSINALTLSPALCGVLLRKDQKPIGLLSPIESGINTLTDRYRGAISWILKKGGRVGLFVILVFGASAWLLMSVPTSFVPPEDQGYLFVDVQLPDAASSNRTDATMKKVTDLVLKDPAVTDFISVAGFSMLGGAASSNGLGIVVLKDWEERTTPELALREVVRRLQGQLWAMPDAQIMVFNLPPIPGLGATAGFEFRLQDTEGRDPKELANVLNALIYEANQRPDLEQVFSTFRANVPQYILEVDRDKAKAQGVPLTEIFTTLQAHLGSLYINDFSRFARSYKVYIQSESQFRSGPDDLRHFYVRNADGQMVPLLTMAQLLPSQGPTSINHFNLYRSATVSGQAAAGYSSGQAIQAVDTLATTFPGGYTYEWSGQSLQEIKAGNLAPLLFALALIFVYLFLVAQYESWSLPFTVIGAVPLALFGAMAGLLLAGMANNIYSQVGLILLLGLSTKTAILIVEFAMHQRDAGQSVFDAALNAAHLRFRAVLMTAFSFILGVLPLVFASGAGAASRISLGFTVFCGMLAATILGTLLIPFFYQQMQHLREKWGGEGKAKLVSR